MFCPLWPCRWNRRPKVRRPNGVRRQRPPRRRPNARGVPSSAPSVAFRSSGLWTGAEKSSTRQPESKKTCPANPNTSRNGFDPPEESPRRIHPSFRRWKRNCPIPKTPDVPTTCFSAASSSILYAAELDCIPSGRKRITRNAHTKFTRPLQRKIIFSKNNKFT